MDDRLALKVTHPDGSVRRWGFDQPDARDIPGDLTVSSAMPGGYRTLTCGLLRNILDADGPSLFSSVECYGPGGRTVFDGYFTQFPRDDQTITPGAVGWSAVMKFDTGFTELYVNRDMGMWGEDPLSRRLLLSGGAVSQGDFSFNNGGPGGLVVLLPNQALGTSTIAETYFYTPPGINIAKLMYKGATTSLPAGWVTRFQVGAAEDLSGAIIDTLTLDGTLRTDTPASPGRFAMLQVYSNGNAATPAAGAAVRYERVALYGNHGLTSRTISGEPDGFYGHDVIANVIQRAAPMLSTAGVESNTSFVIPQAAFLTPTTAEEAVMALNAYFLWEWGVYDDREFFWRAPDQSRLIWNARRDLGARITSEGSTAEQQFNGVLVFYTDTEGKRRTVGPPAAYWPAGVAHADTTDSNLVDTSLTNPLNAAGFSPKWGKLEIAFPTTDAGAATLGLVWLAEHSLPQHRGTITVTGAVEHPQEGLVPAWRVRAGDWIKIGDLPGDEPRRIIEAGYNHGTRQAVCSVGSTDYRLDAILERVGVSLVGVL